MAFYDNEEEDLNQLDPNNQGGVQTSAGSSTISGQGAAPGAPAPQATAKPDNPGNFVGITQYLNANKPQAEKLGDQTAGIINTSADQARQGVGALNQAAQDSIKPINQLDAGITNKIQTGAEALTQEERDLAKKTASAKYTGPKNETELGDVYTNAAKASKTAVDNINNSGTEQGRMNLISQVNQKPRTQGINTFDNVLLQAGGGREKLAQASAANQDVMGAMDASTEAIRNQIGRVDDPNTPDVDESSGAMGLTPKIQADAYKQIQDAMSAWKSGFTPKVSQAQNDLVDFQNRVTSDLGDNPFGLDQETMDLLGLSQGQRIYGLNLNDYLTQASPSDINAGNVASAEDYARYAALADLSGEQDLLLNPENVSQAGTYKKTSADTAKLAQDRAAAEAAFNTAAQAARERATVSRNSEFGSGNIFADQSISDYLANGFRPSVSTNVDPAFANVFLGESQSEVAAAKSQLQNRINQWLQANGYNSQIKKN